MESNNSFVVQVVNLENREVSYVNGIGDDGGIDITTTSEFTKAQVFSRPYAMLIARDLENCGNIVKLIKIR